MTTCYDDHTARRVAILRRIQEALYNVPMVGKVYDQQHSDTQLKAALLAEDLIAELTEEA